MKASFSLQSGSFLLLASFLFNVKLPSSPGQTAGSLARLMHFPFIIFPDAMLLSCLLRLPRIKWTANGPVFALGWAVGRFRSEVGGRMWLEPAWLLCIVKKIQ